MAEELYFRSIGYIRGTYLPSSDSLTDGNVLTKQGIFPATMEPALQKFFERCDNKRKIAKKRRDRTGRRAIQKEQGFICSIVGLETEPNYRLCLIGRRSKGNTRFNNLLPEPNTFLTRGIVLSKVDGEVVHRIQLNKRPERSDEEIANYRNNIKILDCPGKVRRNQFWQFKSSLENGYLHCKAADLLGLAKESKKLLLP